MIAVFFITKTEKGFKVEDDMSRSFGEFKTKKQAEEKYHELCDKYY